MASADASADFVVCSVYTNRKNRRGQQFICRRPLRIIFRPHPSQNLRIFRWGQGDATPLLSEVKVVKLATFTFATIATIATMTLVVSF